MIGYFKQLSPLNRFNLEGSFRGVVSIIPASGLFAIISMVNLYVRNGKLPFDEHYPVQVAIGTSVVTGLFFSFLPSLIGGWILASWIYTDVSKKTSKSGAIKGLACGATAMFGFDFIVGLTFLSASHGPSMNMFIFYVISSTVIAGITGAIVGLQLMKKILKAEIP